MKKTLLLFTLIILSVISIPFVSSSEGNQSTETKKFQNGLLGIISSHHAKELCSCLFVMNRNKTWCLEYISYGPPLHLYSIDESNKKVSVRSALIKKSEARFINKDLGCKILNKKPLIFSKATVQKSTP